jgi:hypothetical protein
VFLGWLVVQRARRTLIWKTRFRFARGSTINRESTEASVISDDQRSLDCSRDPLVHSAQRKSNRTKRSESQNYGKRTAAIPRRTNPLSEQAKIALLKHGTTKTLICQNNTTPRRTTSCSSEAGWSRDQSSRIAADEARCRNKKAQSIHERNEELIKLLCSQI